MNNLKKKFFVFDFDLTLTDTHSRGRPSVTKLYISSTQNELIIETFKAIKKDNLDNKIYILSRGYQNDIMNYLKNKHNELFKYIDEIVAAKTIEEIELGTEYWAKYKTEILEKFVQEFNEYKIIFFDDTIENINVAKSNNIIAIHVLNPNNINNLVKTQLNNNPTTTPTNKTKALDSPIPVDLTQEFSGSVGNAMKYYSTYPVEYSIIYSTSKKAWYENSLDKPTEFYLIADCTNKFNGSVQNAIKYFKSNQYDRCIIKSTDLNKWFISYLENDQVKFAGNYSDHSVESQKIKLLDSPIPVDLTLKFYGSVRNAINYYLTNPFEYSIIYSTSKKAWYENSLDKPSVFYPIADCTNKFNGSVQNAIKYFKSNQYHRCIIKSTRLNEWYISYLENDQVKFAGKYSDHSILDVSIKYKLIELIEDLANSSSASRFYRYLYPKPLEVLEKVNDIGQIKTNQIYITIQSAYGAYGDKIYYLKLNFVNNLNNIFTFKDSNLDKEFTISEEDLNKLIKEEKVYYHKQNDSNQSKFNSKYLKYKVKYLELKNSLNTK